MHSTWISSQEEDNDEEEKAEFDYQGGDNDEQEKGEEDFLDKTGESAGSGPPTTFHNIGILEFYSI